MKHNLNIYETVNVATICGWSVSLSSDGYINFGAGNQLDDGYAFVDGYNGALNPNAWYVLSNVIGGQEYQFSIQTDGYMGLRIKYSKLGFDGYTAGIIQTPSATDEQILFGSGMDVAPVYQEVLHGHFNFTKY